MADNDATGARDETNPPWPAPETARSPDPAPKLGKFDRPRHPYDWRFFVGGVGKVLIAIGLMMFGFVAYQLWGTGIETARAQNSLESEFNELLAGTTPDESTTTTAAPVDTEPSETAPDTVPVETVPVETAPDTVPVETAVPVEEQELPSFNEGDAILRLEIPRIGVDWIVVAGVEKSDLKKGPGHYPETPLPGQLGNAAIAGHRTTYGQPFYSIEQLQPGDEIITTTPQGRFVYVVTGQQIVSPDDYEVITTTDPSVATLTLTSCHPRWTTQQRIVITSELDQDRSDPVGEAIINYGRPIDPAAEGVPEAVAPIETSSTVPTTVAPDVDDSVVDDSVVESVPVTTAAAAPATTDPPATDPDSLDAGIADAFAEGWFSDPSANPQVALWGVILALVGLGSYLISRKAKRDWVGALVGIIPFAVALYFFFQNVNRLLPPNL